MPSRRSHTKSHHGCRQCKARRVKVALTRSPPRLPVLPFRNADEVQCDETAPACQRCVKRQITCSFLEDGTDGFLTPAASSGTEHLTPSISDQHTPEVTPRRYDPLPLPTSEPRQQQQQQHLRAGTAAPLPKRFDLLELELIHHYCTRTYMTMSSRLSTHVIFRDAVFREALRHDFLLHALMATSALHKATTQPKSSEAYEEYAKVALTHQNAALAGYIPAVNNPNQDNGIALFTLSLLLTIWAFASKSLPEGLRNAGVGLFPPSGSSEPHLPVHSPTSQFVDIIIILGGIYPVMNETESWLQGEIEEMLRYPRDEDLPAHPPDVEEAFDILAEAIRNHQPQRNSDNSAIVDSRKLCLEQVHRLRDISRCRSVVEWDGHILSWFIMAPPDYITCIKQGNTLALATFAHWAAAFRCMDHHWWANGWAQTLVMDISNLLDLQVWSNVLEWPRRQVGLFFQDGATYENRRVP